MMSFRISLTTLLGAIAALALLLPTSPVQAQITSYQCTPPTSSSSSSSSTTVSVSEDFTCNTTVNQWFFYNGACLTAGANTSTTSPGYIPSCPTVLGTYYNVANPTTQKQADPWLAGGYYGYLGQSSAPSSGTAQKADPIINQVGHGALRFTNADGNDSNGSYGYHENGAVVSNFTFPTTQGIEITFKTATYYGDGGGAGGDGADGISFYLLDACMPLAGATIPATLNCGSTTNSPYKSAYGSSTFPGIGAWGGSLAYTCSNGNSPYDGLTGAYLGLGIDEYGNFLNGSSNTLSETDSTSTNNGNGDNTASGGLYLPGRIGLRGAGSVSWQALYNAYGSYVSSSNPYYPSSMTQSCYVNGGTYSSSSGLCVTTNSNGSTTSNPTDAMAAVQKTCQNGTLYNFAGSGGTVSSSSVRNPSSVTPATLNSKNTANILDYPAIAYAELSGLQIANEQSPFREGSPPGCSTASNASNPCNTSGSGNNIITYGPATPITYDLKITPDGMLSLKYSVNGAAYNQIIPGQNFTSTIGAIPANVRFGFAGSDGGATNIHEIMCFKAAPAQSSSTSGSVTVYQDPTIKTGAQIFTAFYNPNDWSGRLESQEILFDTTLNTEVVQSAPTWDASCVLTPASASPASTPVPTWCTSITTNTETPGSRQILTWNDTTSAAASFEWANLSNGQSTALAAQTRLNYLRGDRSNELTPTNTSGLYRERTSVLADIVDSSPAWVGPPQSYTSVTSWVDNLNTGTTQPENGTSAQTYSTFASTYATRENVVYVGSNDGLLHGFRAGGLDSNGNLTTTNYANDGYEVMAYMPASVIQTIHNSSNALDYSNTLYSHNWFVDAPPASGDVFYNNLWHTWLVGGLGPGGKAIYALNVTDPSQFSESAPATTVVGEWNSTNIQCVQSSGSSAACGTNLGNTYGTPEIRRFHSGDWGVIFGNGLGSSSGNAGIFIMLISHTSGTPSFYFLPTGTAATGNGIVSADSLDIDQDHVVDYIYAGDINGNVWRWDVTSSTPTAWITTAPFKLFTTPGGATQPITTRVVSGTLRTVSSVVTLSGQTLSNGPERIIVNFGTGQMVPLTNTTPTTYATGQQYLFGVWDWNMGVVGTSGSGWNGKSPAPAQLAVSLATPGPGLLGSITGTNLVQQTITTTTPTAAQALAGYVATRKISTASVCYDTTTGCSTQQYGWYIALPATNEQIIYNPVISPEGELVVNTVIPVTDSPLTCTTATATGFSMGMAPDTGGESPTPFFTVLSNGNAQVDGVQLNGTGTPSFLSSGMKSDNNADYLLTQTNNGAASPMKINRHAIVNGQRLNWLQRR